MKKEWVVRYKVLPSNRVYVYKEIILAETREEALKKVTEDVYGYLVQKELSRVRELKCSELSRVML